MPLLDRKTKRNECKSIQRIDPFLFHTLSRAVHCIKTAVTLNAKKRNIFMLQYNVGYEKI